MRQLDPKLTAFLDKKLAQNGAAQDAIKRKDARSLMIYAAESCVGIREEGSNRGPMVSLIQDTVDGPDHVAWCMSFVQTCIAYAELKTGVKSPIAAGEHCLTVWQSTPKAQRVKIVPLPGAIVIWQHGSSTSGHTGIVTEWKGKVFEAVEGNTGGGITAKGTVVREGDGVYMTERNATGTGTMKVVGFLKPF